MLIQDLFGAASVEFINELEEDTGDSPQPVRDEVAKEVEFGLSGQRRYGGLAMCPRPACTQGGYSHAVEVRSSANTANAPSRGHAPELPRAARCCDLEVSWEVLMALLAAANKWLHLYSSCECTFFFNLLWPCLKLPR